MRIGVRNAKGLGNSSRDMTTGCQGVGPMSQGVRVTGFQETWYQGNMVEGDRDTVFRGNKGTGRHGIGRE